MLLLAVLLNTEIHQEHQYLNILPIRRLSYASRFLPPTPSQNSLLSAPSCISFRVIWVSEDSPSSAGQLNHTPAHISDVKSSMTSWPRGQNFVLGLGLGLEVLSSALASSICPWHVLKLFIWPRENECNDGAGNRCEFVMIIYQSYLLTNLVLLI